MTYFYHTAFRITFPEATMRGSNRLALTQVKAFCGSRVEERSALDPGGKINA
jgi:hypothetical protein